MYAPELTFSFPIESWHGGGGGGVIGKKWCQLLSLKGKLGGMNSTNINHYDFVCYAMREEIHINSGKTI